MRRPQNPAQDPYLHAHVLNAHTHGRRKIGVNDVTRIPRCSWLEDENLRLVVGRGAMLNSMGDDEKLTCAELHDLISKLDSEAAPHTEEEFILSVVMVPREGALELDEFDFLTVELPDDLGAPVLRDERKLLSEVHLFHRSSAPPSR